MSVIVASFLIVVYPLKGVSNHWIGIWTGMEWNGTIRNSEITKFAFSFYSSIALHYGLLTLYFCLKTVTCILLVCFKKAKINYSFKTRYY